MGSFRKVAARIHGFTLAVGIISLITPRSSCAQTGDIAMDTLDRTEIARSIYGLGANFSGLSGTGIAFRDHLAGNFSFMVSGYVYKPTGEAHFNYGAELQYDLRVRDRTRFYLLAGAS